MTPSDIFSWQGPTEPLTRSSGRIAVEQKWYAVTGRVVELRAEPDGDLHVALQDATGDKPGIVVAEISAKPHKRWCELRKIVLSWTHPKFPFRVRSGRNLKITEPRIITVTGKAFFDINHAPADQSNRRTDLKGYAGWEIHPVVELGFPESGGTNESRRQRIRAGDIEGRGPRIHALRRTQQLERSRRRQESARRGLGALEDIAQATTLSRWQDSPPDIARNLSDVCRQNLWRAAIFVTFTATLVLGYENP